MRELLKNGYRAKRRPSGHDISDKFSIDNGAAIPPNLIAAAHTESNSFYLRYCREHGIDPHPARYPAELPEFFIRMLTDPNDFVVDPFAGSCVTGEVCERLKRRWLCGELCEEYLQGALGRFKQKHIAESNKLSHPGVLWNDLEKPDKDDESNYYKLPRPGTLWNDTSDSPLANDGGKKRQKATDKHKNKRTSEKP